MDSYTQEKIPIEKEMLLNSMKDISNYLNSINQQSQYYILFNETLFQNNNKWLDDIKYQIKNLLSNKNQKIIIPDIKYDNKIKSLIRKIAEPQNHKKFNQENEDGNIIEEKNAFYEKVDELTNFNDIIGAVNSCSRHKRSSLLSAIHKKNDENNINFSPIEKNENENVKKNENIYDYLNDEDLNVNFSDSNEQKEKIINNNVYQLNLNEDEEIENSLCTIVEQPSIEDLDKNTFSQKKINLLNSNKFSLSDQMNIQASNKVNTQSSNNRKEYILDLNKKESNESNSKDKNILPNTDNKKAYKHLVILESITTPQKSQEYLMPNSYNKIPHDNIFNSKMNTPNFININSNQNSSNKDPLSMNNTFKKMDSQFSFNHTNSKLINKNNSNNNNNAITFNFSTTKKCDKNDIPSENNINSNINNNKIIEQTFKKNNEPNINDNSNNKNFINILTNSINNINNNNKNQYSNIKIQNSNNKSNNIDDCKFSNIKTNKNNLNSESSQKKYVQKIVLTSSKRANTANKNNINKNVEKINMYENDFEEYEMSDTSLIEDEEDEIIFNNKKVPKWAMDKKYINYQIAKQNNDPELRIKSFGNFVVENLNLNMILETHNQLYEIRNSTADWRGEDSFGKNKATKVIDKEIDNMFPNRKLNF